MSSVLAFEFGSASILKLPGESSAASQIPERIAGGVRIVQLEFKKELRMPGDVCGLNFV